MLFTLYSEQYLEQWNRLNFLFAKVYIIFPFKLEKKKEFFFLNIYLEKQTKIFFFWIAYIVVYVVVMVYYRVCECELIWRAKTIR